MFALVDCNSFYCSCERVFRPDLRNRPIIVLSNNDGCVVSASKEAKEAGILMFSPYFKNVPIILKHKISVFSSNYALYADLSLRVMNTLGAMAPQMEVYSIDEAFLDLRGLKHFDLLLWGKKVKEKIWHNVGIPVSVGIAPTKVLAKVACHLAKKKLKHAGVADLSTLDAQEENLDSLQVGDVWGIGAAFRDKLNKINIKTALQFRNYQNRKHIARLLTKVGLQIQDELKGISCLPLSTICPPKKTICSTRSFGSSVTSLSSLKESAAYHASIIGEKLRKQKSKAYTLFLYIRTNPFKATGQYFNQGQHTFLSPSSDSRKLICVAHNILEDIYKSGFEYKKLGVIVSNLVDEKMVQSSLWSSGDLEIDNNLMQAMDNINFREGLTILKSAACGTKGEWKMLRNMKSPSYTTKWSDIPCANNRKCY